MAEEQKPQTTPAANKEQRALAEPGFAFVPQTWDQLWSYANEISKTDFVPKEMQNKPGAVLAAWQKGKEVGLPPMASLQYITVINGRPSIYAEGFWMLVTNHPLCEWIKELSEQEALAQGYAECTVKRRGWPEPTTRRFTVDEAKKADLWEKKDNYRKYPGPMLVWRARHRAATAAIPEATGGLVPAEIAYDYETTATTVKEEPLKIPQAVKESEETPTAQPSTESEEEPGVEGARQPLVGQPAGGVGESPNGPDADDKAERKASTRPDPKPKTADERVADLEDWLQNRATPEEILANRNYLTQRLKGLPAKVQTNLCFLWNSRRKAVQAEREKAKTDESA